MPRGKSARKRRPPVNRHFKIEHVLPPPVLAEYLDHLREPGTTVDTAHTWLNKRGFGGRFSRSAVARHKRHYLEGVESQRQAQESARMFALLAANPKYSNDNMLAGALLGAEQQLLKAVFDLRAEGYRRQIDPSEILSVIEVLRETMLVRRKLDNLRRRAAPAAAAATASKPNYDEIAAEVRKLLGGDEPASSGN
jgi:hypothetical protein